MFLLQNINACRTFYFPSKDDEIRYLGFVLLSMSFETYFKYKKAEAHQRLNASKETNHLLFGTVVIFFVRARNVCISISGDPKS